MDIPNNLDFQTDNVGIKLTDDILYVYYTPKNPKKRIDATFAKEAVLDRQKFTNGKKHLMLIDARIFGEVDKKAMDYWSTDEAVQDVLAGAIVTDKPITYMAAKLYLGVKLLFKKPDFPAQMFKTEKGAIKWLLKQHKTITLSESSN